MGESYGKWPYTRDITGPRCKGMPRTLLKNVKNSKSEGMKYILATKGCTWILVAIELFTKWVEVVAMKKVKDSSVANFLRENIICRFGVPNKIISDNGTPFLNKDVHHLKLQIVYKTPLNV